MQNFQKQNELLEAKYFQVEELEERLENGWKSNNTKSCLERSTSVTDWTQGGKTSTETNFISVSKDANCPQTQFCIKTITQFSTQIYCN